MQYLDSGIPSWVVQAEDMEPLLNNIVENLTVFVPPFLVLFATFLGVSIVPRLLSRFIKF